MKTTTTPAHKMPSLSAREIHAIADDLGITTEADSFQEQTDSITETLALMTRTGELTWSEDADGNALYERATPAASGPSAPDARYVRPQDARGPFFVFGYTDHWRQTGFPACDGEIQTLEAAIEHLRGIGDRGFGWPNTEGWRGWITDESGRTVKPLPAPDPAPYTPLPEAVSLARLLAADTSPDGMAAVLSGFLRSRNAAHAAEVAQLRAALAQ